jgi:hypothetical protein
MPAAAVLDLAVGNLSAKEESEGEQLFCPE